MKIFGSMMKKVLSAVVAAGIAVGTLTVQASALDVPKNDATVFADSLGTGWNLGNAFDASDCTWLSDELDYETAWCGAKTTKELIKEVKKAGFDTIRVPVSWHNHVDKDYNISKAWADRVQEVVDWCLDEGLFVILDVHHDVDKNYYFPTSDKFDNTKKFLTAVWKQVAERYSKYDERLIFQIINEPRLKGDNNNEWWFAVNSPSEPVKDAIDCINKLNQAALDTIRAAGGKNKDRYVMVGGYCNSPDGIMTEGFALPEDSANGRLIVSMHHYVKNKSWYQTAINQAYKKYVSEGIPVVLDEYNIDANKNVYDKESPEYLGTWVAYARKLGISTIIWDNNDKQYKVFDRKTATVVQKDIVDAIVKEGAPSLSTPSSKPAASVDKPSDSSSEKPADKPAAESSAKAKKPVLTAKSDGKKAVLTWTAVDGATKYRVYQYIDGKKTKVQDTKKLTAKISGLKKGKSYKFAVSAYKDGKWTSIKTSDIKKVKI